MFEQISCGSCEKQLNDRVVTGLLAHPMLKDNARCSELANFLIESEVKGEMQLDFLAHILL